MKLRRSVEANATPEMVFAYLSDFTHANEWDPATVKAELISGDGGVGTKYHNVSTFMGRATELTYQVVRHEPHQVFALRGENSSVIALDTMEIEPNGFASKVTYTADFQFKGLGKFIAPLLSPALKKLGDEVEHGLREALAKL
jgi:carbon monoxide dehydrogenase subunit G